MFTGSEEIKIVNVRERQRRHWALATAVGVVGNVITLWLTSKRSTAVLGTSIAIVAFYLGYLYAKDIE